MTLEQLLTPVQLLADECVNCGICVKECAFLQEYGSPQRLATSWQDGKKENPFSFECSLCGLCHGVCPKKLDPSAMFLEMRRELVAKGQGTFPQHKTIRSYEKRGSSDLFSWYYLPDNCQTVLFPGCAFPGSRPQTFLRLFQCLQELFPGIGLVFDCCSKPSHDLGNVNHFRKMFAQLCQILNNHAVQKVLVTCPNCYRIFSEYGDGLQVESVYETLAGTQQKIQPAVKGVTVHDPCGVRFAAPVQESVRLLLQQLGVSVDEMKHSRQVSFCCGEGGSAGFLRPDFAKTWTDKRVAEAGAMPMVTYCAGCTHFLGKKAVTDHLLDLLFSSPEAGKHGPKVSKAPFTYWNRYRLKRQLQKKLPGGVCGTRKQMQAVSSID